MARGPDSIDAVPTPCGMLLARTFTRFGSWLSESQILISRHLGVSLGQGRVVRAPTKCADGQRSRRRTARATSCHSSYPPFRNRLLHLTFSRHPARPPIALDAPRARPCRRVASRRVGSNSNAHRSWPIRDVQSMTTYVILELQLNILRIFSRWASSILLKSLISASRFADMGLDDSTAVPSESPTYDRFCELVAHATRRDDNIIRIYNERATDTIYSYILVLISRANLRVHSYTYSYFAQNFSSLSQQRIDRISIYFSLATRACDCDWRAHGIQDSRFDCGATSQHRTDSDRVYRLSRMKTNGRTTKKTTSSAESVSDFPT